MHGPEFPEIFLPGLEQVVIPQVRRITLQTEDTPAIENLEEAVQEALSGSRRLPDIPKGSEIAIAVGSRGISNLVPIVKQTVATLKKMGLNPFIVPAMGSHGGGTAEGQRAILEKLGIVESSTGAPVRATMETVVLGETEPGVLCHLDREAASAAGIVAINRVKSHTSFDRPIESGLCKIVAVGLGKAQGAKCVHAKGPAGLSEILPRNAKLALDSGHILFGLALVENKKKQVCHLEGVEPESFHETDQRLLAMAKRHIPRLPFKEIDVLIVQEVGKEISGAGMDQTVVGRVDIRGIPNPKTPFITKICLLGLSQKTMGNGIGIGMADYTTRNVVRSLDLHAMYLNSFTATNIERIRIPMVLPTDEDAIRAAVATCWQTDPGKVRLCIIRSTLEVDSILVSAALMEEIQDTHKIAASEPPADMEFDSKGCLSSLV